MSFTTEQVVQIYVATFNRAPDAAGLDYWVNDSGFTNIEDVASSFFDSEEAEVMYPSGTSNTAMVQSAYQNLFGRDADTDGLDYWVGELDAGNFSQSLMLQAMINGAQDTDEFGNDATMMANKTTIGLSFANAGQTDIVLARNIIENITDNLETVEEAHLIILSLPEAMTNEYKFTQEWLTGKTLYNVYDENQDGIFNDLTIMTFSSDIMSGVGFDGGESVLSSYRVDDNGVISILENDRSISYISGIEELTALNAISIVWSDSYEYATTITETELSTTNDKEYFFLDLLSAQEFIA